MGRSPKQPVCSGPYAWQTRFSWHDAAILAGIILLALTVRISYVLQLRSSPLFAFPQVDELYHDQWAQAIADGQTFVDEPYFRAPLYPAFLAGVYKLFGHDYLAPRIIQAVLGSLSCGLVFLIGRRAFGRVVGSIAGVVAATYWMLVYFDGELLVPSLIIFLDLTLVWLLLHAASRPGVLVCAAAGAVLGLSAIARPNILLFAPVIVLWMLILYRKRFRRAFVHVACMTAACLAVVLPIAIRNYVVGHDFVLISSQGGVNFYIGNNAHADGHTAVVPEAPTGGGAGGGAMAGFIDAVTRLAETERGRSLKPSDVSRFYSDRALSFIGKQPTDFLKLTIRKLRLFWSRREISNNKNIDFFTRRFTPVVRLLPLRFGWVAPLGILGLALCWRRRGELFPLWGFVLVYMVSVVAFFCTARFRAPVLPVLIILAAFAACQMVSAIIRARWKPVLGALAVLAPAALLVNVPPPTGPEGVGPFDYVMLGRAYAWQDKTDEAEANFRRALEVNPQYLTARLELGVAYRRAGRLDEAIEELRHAVVTPPNWHDETQETVAWAHQELGNALHQSGKLNEAAAEFRAAIAVDAEATQGDAQFYLGVVLNERGRTVEARAAFGQAAEIIGRTWRKAPNRSRRLLQLGQAVYMQGKRAEAIEPLRELLRIDPDNSEAADYLSLSLLELGCYREAAETLRLEAAMRDPRLVNRLALILAAAPDDTLRDGAAALQYAQRLCPRIESCRIVYLATLAAALAENGRYGEAAELTRTAISRSQQSPDPSDRRLAAPLAAQLALYEAGQPYRLPTP